MLPTLPVGHVVYLAAVLRIRIGDLFHFANVEQTAAT